MGTEIERKFLVVSDAWKTEVPGKIYRQGYLSINEQCDVRVRIAGNSSFLTIKGKQKGISRAEFEYEIPLTEAEELLRLCPPPLVEKTRHTRDFAGKTWEIDEFHGANNGLVMAEVELSSESDALELPSWCGKEVSDDKKYYNAYLSRNPYSTWT
jgi:adenylate cyclase